MKKGLQIHLRYKLFAFFLIFLMPSLDAQVNVYSFTDIGMSEEYLSSGFCRTLNYYWDQGLIDGDGNIYFVFVDNYKLFYFISEDDGQSWEKHQVQTAQDGNVYNAMGALTQDGRLVIIYAVNEGFSGGAVSYGSEFRYDLYGAVQGEENWEFKSLFTSSTNNGLLPFGTITIKSGMVHVVLYKYGWYNYGGELYEVVYNPAEGEWSDIETIKIFGDRSVDHSTFHVCKLVEGENDSIICVYQRHGPSTSYNNLELVMRGAEGWTEPRVVLENSDYATYNRFDLDYDRHGHYYFGYFIPYGPDGPEVCLAHNSYTDFEKYKVFDAADTLRKISIHPYPDGVAYIYLNFKDSLPEIWKLSQQGFQQTGFLPSFDQEDSVDVMRFHYQIPVKNNFSERPGLKAFTNRYAGKEGNTVLSYPLVYVSAGLEKDITAVPGIEEGNKAFMVYPNPGDGHPKFISEPGTIEHTLLVFNVLGKQVKVLTARSNQELDLSDLERGVYLILERETASVLKYIRQ